MQETHVPPHALRCMLDVPLGIWKCGRVCSNCYSLQCADVHCGAAPQALRSDTCLLEPMLQRCRFVVRARSCDFILRSNMHTERPTCKFKTCFATNLSTFGRPLQTENCILTSHSQEQTAHRELKCHQPTSGTSGTPINDLETAVAIVYAR